MIVASMKGGPVGDRDRITLGGLAAAALLASMKGGPVGDRDQQAKIAGWTRNDKPR